MINKISISEEFLRSQDPSLLAPLFSGVNAEYAAVLMFKSLNQMRISQMAKDALAKAVADARPATVTGLVAPVPVCAPDDNAV